MTAQGPRLRNYLYCVKCDVKLYYTIELNLLVSVFFCLSSCLSVSQSVSVTVIMSVIFSVGQSKSFI